MDHRLSRRPELQRILSDWESHHGCYLSAAESLNNFTCVEILPKQLSTQDWTVEHGGR